METSPQINEIAAALAAAQSEMGNATKGSTNPYFKNRYADLNAIREAALPVLNKHGISVIQPNVTRDGKNYVKTVLLHASGQYIAGETEILFREKDNPQAQGSGITYARRYGLQSICNIGADDDDGNQAAQGKSKGNDLPWLTDAQFNKAIERIKAGEDLLPVLQAKFRIKRDHMDQLTATKPDPLAHEASVEEKRIISWIAKADDREQLEMLADECTTDATVKAYQKRLNDLTKTSK